MGNEQADDPCQQDNKQQIITVVDGKNNFSALPWYHTKQSGKPGFLPMRTHTMVEPLICGSRTIPSVCNALWFAEESIEISVWVLDPALCMYGYHQEVVEEYELRKSLYKRISPRLGDVLLQAADRGVKVKLLIWDLGDLLYNVPRMIAAAKEMGGKIDSELVENHILEIGGGSALLSLSSMVSVIFPAAVAAFSVKLGAALAKPGAIANWVYRYRWYKAVAAHGNIELRVTAPAPLTILSKVKELLSDPSKLTSPEANVDALLADFLRQNAPSHHQKTVIVDYENPKLAHGYVMGNNFRSVDFDTPEHPAKPPERGGRYPDDGPRRDMSAHVRGPALHDVNATFCRVWNEKGKKLERSGIEAKVFAGAKSFPDPTGNAQVSCTIMGGTEPDFICNAYESAFCCCTRYVYMENQYFRYAPLARFLVKRATTRFARDSQAKSEPIYYFVVVNSPDSYSGDTTYEMLEAMGHEEQLSGELRKRYEEAKKEYERLFKDYPVSQDPYSAPIPYPEGSAGLARFIDEMESQFPNIQEDPVENKDTPDAEKAFRIRDIDGFKGHLATLTVYRQKDWNERGKYEYKPVNIHTKAMIVDDVFATIGSANLNKRGMESDNEVNISATRPGMAQTLREEVFQQLLGENAQGTWQKIYEIWKRRLDWNWKAIYEEKPLSGLLTYLYVPKAFNLPTLD